MDVVHWREGVAISFLSNNSNCAIFGRIGGMPKHSGLVWETIELIAIEPFMNTAESLEIVQGSLQ
jgi:hypothetical protein